MPRKKKRAEPDKWEVLCNLIQEYADAYVAESWKGGGDPEEMPLRDAELKLAKLRLEYHINRMKEEQ